MAALATQPAIPDASSLAGLDPTVALAFLAVVALGMILFYFGPAMRDRLSKKPGQTPELSSTAPIPPVLPSPVSVLDRTTEVTNKLIEALNERIADLLSERRDQDVENDELRRELRAVHVEIERIRGDYRALQVEHERLRADQWRRP